MQKEEGRGCLKKVLLTMVAGVFVLFILVPLSIGIFAGQPSGNVALIPIEGPITVTGESMLGQSATSSQEIIDFLQQAEEEESIQAIVLEINSPGGSAVAADEIAQAIKRNKKPVIAVIREMGASGGYWIASASSHIIANRMSITGSIGVISSYLEFSGLMEKYGVSYEQLTAGKYKDMGTPFKGLTSEERQILEKKLNTIHRLFIEEIAVNRNLPVSAVEKLATGEFYLGTEAQQLGLVDELGDRQTAETYLQEKLGIIEVELVLYHHEASFFELLTQVFSSFSFRIGEGIGSMILHHDSRLLLL